MKNSTATRPIPATRRTAQNVERLIKIGRQGVTARGGRVPASFFRHQQPGKRFVVLDGGERRLMHVRAGDLDAIRAAYRDYASARAGNGAATDGRGEP